MPLRMQWGWFFLECSLVFAYAGLLFWASSQASVLPLYPPEYHIDKIVHLVAFSVLGFLLAWPTYRLTGSLFWAVWLAAILGGFYGILDEFHQGYVPGRTADIYDIYADICGSFLGGLLFWRFRRQK